MKINSYRALTQILIILFLASIIFVWLNYYDGIAVIENIKDKYGLWLLLITIPIQVILSVTPFPSEAFAFGIAILLGFKLGALSIWVAWLISAYVEYKLIQNTKKDIDLTINYKKIPSFLKRIPINSPFFLILGLYLPFGSHVVIGTAAINNINIKRLMICCAIGYTPYSLLVSGIANNLILN